MRTTNDNPARPRSAATRRWLMILCSLMMAGWAGGALGADDPAADAGRGPRAGRVIRVTAPITTGLARRVGQEAQEFIKRHSGQQPVLIFEIQPGESTFGDAYNLAREILNLSGATTVAFLPRGSAKQPAELKGHAVLVALACQRLVLDGESYFGRADAWDKKPSEVKETAYREIAKSRNFPADLALSFWDPTLEIFEAETATKQRLFLSKEHLAERKKTEELATKTKWGEAGQTGRFNGRELAAMGLVKSEDLVGGRTALASALGLRPENMEEDPFFGTEIRAAIFPIDNEKTIQRAPDKIQEQIRKHQVNLVILDIDSAGGDPAKSADLAQFLAKLKPHAYRTVALVRGQAAGGAALIAVACDHVLIMPDGKLGGDGDLNKDARGDKEERQQIATYATVLADLARAKGRSPSLAVALIDPRAVVHRYVRDNGQEDYFSQLEFAGVPNPNAWKQQEAITVDGAALTLGAERAIQLGMATGTVANREELKALYGLESDPPEVGTDWVDTLVEVLHSWGVQWFLLVIGLTAFYAEMNSPGHGVGGFIATVCFLLFFWANFLGGSADWLEILMFLVGIVLLLIEIFVIPGFGIVGVGGIVLVLLSVVMAMQTFHGLPHTHRDMLELRDSLTVVTLAAIGALACGALVRRLLPRTRGMSDLILAPAGKADAQLTGQPDALGDYQHFVGQTGVTVTQLTPSGKARIDDQLVDVLSEGDVVPRGASVIVVETHGNRIVVRAV
jgi:membrane-bound serine protease (ClpP class)